MTSGRTRAARYAKRRATRVAASGSDLTDAQWRTILDAWQACAYCGTGDGTMQRDCVIPISRGGRYTVDNVVPACRSCNASKCNTEVTAWMRRKRLNEPAFLRRWVEVLGSLRALPDESVSTG
jgi:5-methylcytosine-specific restriction endonuclease McrA